MIPLSRDSEITGARWLRASSASADVPPFGIVKLTAQSIGMVYTAEQPTADGEWVVVAGPHGIQGETVGVVTSDFPALAAYDPDDGTPAVGEIWGAGVGTYLLKKGRAGFRIAGDPDTETEIVSVERDLTGVTASFGGAYCAEISIDSTIVPNPYVSVIACHTFTRGRYLIFGKAYGTASVRTPTNDWAPNLTLCLSTSSTFCDGFSGVGGVGVDPRWLIASFKVDPISGYMATTSIGHSSVVFQAAEFEEDTKVYLLAVHNGAGADANCYYSAFGTISALTIATVQDYYEACDECGSGSGSGGSPPPPPPCTQTITQLGTAVAGATYAGTATATISGVTIAAGEVLVVTFATSVNAGTAGVPTVEWMSSSWGSIGWKRTSDNKHRVQTYITDETGTDDIVVSYPASATSTLVEVIVSAAKVSNSTLSGGSIVQAAGTSSVPASGAGSTHYACAHAIGFIFQSHTSAVSDGTWTNSFNSLSATAGSSFPNTKLQVGYRVLTSVTSVNAALSAPSSAYWAACVGDVSNV